MNKRTLPEEAYAFTDLYGAIENGLRSIGFCKQHLARAEADWGKFAQEKLGDEFFDEVKKSGRAKTLIEGRPRKQMKENLAWKPDQPLADHEDATEFIVNGICQVRNHIDHHQKFRGDDELRKRDLQLIADAHAVLELVLENHPDLKTHLLSVHSPSAVELLADMRRVGLLDWSSRAGIGPLSILTLPRPAYVFLPLRNCPPMFRSSDNVTLKTLAIPAEVLRITGSIAYSDNRYFMALSPA